MLTTLAKEYALFDRFFASHPGSTYPNRQFVLSGTAHGMTDTGNEVHSSLPLCSSPSANSRLDCRLSSAAFAKQALQINLTIMILKRMPG